jgi:hypothetical protein
LIVGWISGEDPMYPEAMSARDALGNAVPAASHDDVGGMKSVS